MRVWLDALTIESSRVDALRDTYETVQESVYLRLDFYPLCTCLSSHNQEESGKGGRMMRK
jgi:hypothetical protein